MIRCNVSLFVDSMTFDPSLERSSLPSPADVPLFYLCNLDKKGLFQATYLTSHKPSLYYTKHDATTSSIKVMLYSDPPGANLVIAGFHNNKDATTSTTTNFHISH